MLDCRDVTFSTKLSEQRITRALPVLGKRAIQQILCFALYLLGVNRRLISEALDIPPGSIRSVLRALHKTGLPALEDRRRRTSSFLPPPEAKSAPVTLREHDQWVVVDLGVPERTVRIPRQNPVQVRAVLLSMVNSGLLSKRAVAEHLGLTWEHIHSLARKLHDEGITALLDKRKGQQQDYRFTPEVKAELIQQFVLDVVVEGRTTSMQLSERLLERCQFVLSDRSIRYHMKKLGLNDIKRSLPELLTAARKRFGH